MTIHAKLAAGALFVCGLQGCASFDGMPEPVFATDTAVSTITSRYAYDSVIVAMDGLDESGRAVYRNRVVTSYLMAIDARYFDFRRGLSREIKGGNIGLDIALLGLTGTASIWEKAADELAAGATAIAGGRASLNRELYFERTLPALITLMEAERLRVRTDILRGLARTESEYTIEEAFADITRYQSAATLDGAIARATASAAEDAREAEYDFDQAVVLCRPTPEAEQARRDLLNQLGAPLATSGQTLTDGRARLARAAIATGLIGTAPATDEDTTISQFEAVGTYVRNICTADGVRDFAAKIDAQ